jgi:LCP family protein required for cell wall assembly
VSLTLLILTGIVGVWRILAIVDTVLVTRSRRAFRTRIGGVVAALAAVVLLTHGVIGYYAWSFYDAGSRIFVGGNSPEGSLDPQASPSGSDDFLATPFETPATASSRITVLFTGIDHTIYRTENLTDTLLIASLDPTTHKVALVSFPRDISDFPIWDGTTFHGKINSLMNYAKNHPKRFPEGPLPTLVHELSFLLGTPIHYYAALDIDGFREMIDAVGGVTVDVQRAINDSRYDWLDGSPHGLFIKAGRQKMDGRLALAYVRSRYGIGDNDFTRAARQQQLLVALRAKMTDPAMITRLPTVLGVAGKIIRTNFPPDRIDEMVSLAQEVGDTDIRRVVLQPPTYSVHPPTNTTGGIYTLRLHLDALAALSLELFGVDSSYPATPAPSEVPALGTP